MSVSDSSVITVSMIASIDRVGSVNSEYWRNFVNNRSSLS
jgi:hypothetical protein